MTIIEAINDAHLFRPLFKDLGTWRAWLIFLRALFGLGIEGGDLEVFSECTGLKEAPQEAARECFVISGRRSGKSFMSSLIAVFIACSRDWSKILGPGERGYIFIVAVDKLQARVIKGYVSAILHGSRAFRALMKRELAESIELRNSITIEIKTASFRTIRGYTLVAAIMEELGLWRSEEFANPDREILNAVRPALANVPDSVLIGISTAYMQAGVLFDMFKRHFGKPGGPLVWRATTERMNPTFNKKEIERALGEDYELAKAEYLSEWRADISAFLPLEAVEACVIPGRFELLPVSDIGYFGFIDPSGGRQDSFTLAVAHQSKSGRVVIDCLREARPPLSPKKVVVEFSEVFKKYRIGEISSDRFAGEWPVEAFRSHGIEVKPAELTASELYLELLPMIQSGSVELLENKRLTSQLTNLERRARSGGKDLITHYPGGHDDMANAVAGAAYLARERASDVYVGLSDIEVYGGSDLEFDPWAIDLGPKRDFCAPPKEDTRALTTNKIQPRSWKK